MSPKSLAYGFLLAVIFFAVSLGWFCPRFYLWNPAEFYDFPECNRAVATLLQARAPSADIVPIGGNDVIRWRLLFPTLAYFFKLSPDVLVILPFVFSFLMLWAAGSLIYARTQKLSAAAAATALAATSAPFFVSTGFLCYFDSALALLMIGTVFCERRVSVFALAALAPWVDERFILALPLLLWARAALQKKVAEMILPIALGLAPYLVLRVFAALAGDFTGGYWSNYLRFDHNTKRLFLGLWEGLRWGFAPVMAALLWAKKEIRLGGILIMLAMIFLHLTIAGDYSRSGVIFLPIMLLGVIALAKATRVWLWVLWTLALLNFLTPAHIAFRAFVIPIFNLETQLKIKDNVLKLIREKYAPENLNNL